MTPAQVHIAWKAGREIALIDLREEAEFAVAHPLFAACLPLSRLEIGLFDLVPRSETMIVLYDDDTGLIERARTKLNSWGYCNVEFLEGDLAAWRAAGLELFADVNSPSKAFGELVEQRRETPHVAATDLQSLISEQANIVILDARRFDEYQTMSIPGAVSVPGAELVLRAETLAPDPSTDIIVNCAARTRSIIGTQSLINAGIPNRVMALRNGTIGWTLEGRSLQTDQDRQYVEISAEAAARAAERARSVAYRTGVRHLSYRDLVGLEEPTRTLYRFDVRTEQEYLEGHPPGFRLVPGGQLVQETDMVAPIRGARILLFDDRAVRADMTASWLAQMGWQCFVLDDVPPEVLEDGMSHPIGPPTPDCIEITISALSEADRSSMLLLDLASSRSHARYHVPGARFGMRSRLAEDLPSSDCQKTLVLISPDDRLARYVAAELVESKHRKVVVLKGGTEAWRAAGHLLEAGLVDPISPAQDVYQRPYEGRDNPREQMEGYLNWEYGLVAQLERDGSHGFFVV